LLFSKPTNCFAEQTQYRGIAFAWLFLVLAGKVVKWRLLDVVRFEHQDYEKFTPQQQQQQQRFGQVIEPLPLDLQSSLSFVEPLPLASTSAFEWKPQQRVI